MQSRYINPYTDFGFKKLFGEEANKDLLVDFLNQLLPDKHQIKELSFQNTEQLHDISVDRKAIFDIHCISKTGERFIVEMQKAKIKFFKDRALFYTTFPIKEQAKKGNWNFKLDQIYYIAILDFFYDEEEEKAKVKREIELKDQDCQVFYDKLQYIFLQMPAFNKEENELETHYDKWLYFLKNLEDFDDIPTILKEPIFEKAFETAEIANFNKKEFDKYEKSRLSYLELVNVVKTGQEEGRERGHKEGLQKGLQKGREEGLQKGREEGLQKGREEGELNIAKELITQNILTDEQIAQASNIPLEEIQKIRKSLSK